MPAPTGLIIETYQSRRLNTVDLVAKGALERILALSISSRQEIGGMIWRAQGKIVAGPPKTSKDGGSVKSGLGLPNHGCPEGTEPLASYHTHPNAFVGGVLMAQTEVFSSSARQGVEGRYDEELAHEHGMNSYLGTMLGRFLVFEAKTRKTFQLGTLKNEWNDADKTQLHDIGDVKVVD